MGSIIDKLTAAENKGKLLELVIEDVLNDWKFTNVKRQKSGSQFGYDLIAFKDSGTKRECWKLECKNLRTGTRVIDIAPKLLWHLQHQNIDRFVVISPLGINNELLHLLEKKLFYFPIEVWQGEYLEKIIFESASARARIGIVKSSEHTNARPLEFLPNEIFFDAYHAYQRPFSFDYFLHDNEVRKAYTEHNCIINATFHNPTQDNLTIHQINVLTLDYKTVDSRILRQFKFKGIVEPVKFEFNLKNFEGGKTELLLDSKLLEVKPNSAEHISLILSDQLIPGYYQFVIEICGRFRQKTFEMYSQVFSAHKPHINADIVQLFVIGNHQDDPVRDILTLSDLEWDFLKTKTGCIKPLEGTQKDTIAPFGKWGIEFAPESGGGACPDPIHLDTPLEEPYSPFGFLQGLLDRENQ